MTGVSKSSVIGRRLKLEAGLNFGGLLFASSFSNLDLGLETLDAAQAAGFLFGLVILTTHGDSGDGVRSWCGRCGFMGYWSSTDPGCDAAGDKRSQIAEFALWIQAVFFGVFAPVERNAQGQQPILDAASCGDGQDRVV